MGILLNWAGWLGLGGDTERHDTRAGMRKEDCDRPDRDGWCPYRRAGFGCGDCVVDETTGEVVPRM